MYPIVKHIHLLTITFSLIGFVLRLFWIAKGSPLARAKLTRVLPHVNDALLLFSGMFLAWLTQQYPWSQGWLAAKAIALLVYIYLGSKAIKADSGQRALVFGAVSLGVFSYMVAVAVSKSPWPF